MEEVPSIEVKFIRMVTGEDIISQVVKRKLERGEVYVLLQPLKIGYIMSDSGRIGLSLYQWIFSKITESQEFPIFPQDILTMAKPSISMSKHYWDTIAKYSSSKYEELESSFENGNDDVEYDDDTDMTEEDQKNIMEELSRIKRKYH